MVIICGSKGMEELNKAFSIITEEDIKKALEDKEGLEDLIIYNVDGEGYDSRSIAAKKVFEEFKNYYNNREKEEKRFFFNYY